MIPPQNLKQHYIDDLKKYSQNKTTTKSFQSKSDSKEFIKTSQNKNYDLDSVPLSTNIKTNKINIHKKKHEMPMMGRPPIAYPLPHGSIKHPQLTLGHHPAMLYENPHTQYNSDNTFINPFIDDTNIFPYISYINRFSNQNYNPTYSNSMKTNFVPLSYHNSGYLPSSIHHTYPFNKHINNFNPDLHKFSLSDHTAINHGYNWPYFIFADNQSIDQYHLTKDYSTQNTEHSPLPIKDLDGNKAGSHNNLYNLKPLEPRPNKPITSITPIDISGIDVSDFDHRKNVSSTLPSNGNKKFIENFLQELNKFNLTITKRPNTNLRPINNFNLRNTETNTSNNDKNLLPEALHLKDTNFDIDYSFLPPGVFEENEKLYEDKNFTPNSIKDIIENIMNNMTLKGNSEEYIDKNHPVIPPHPLKPSRLGNDPEYDMEQNKDKIKIWEMPESITTEVNKRIFDYSTIMPSTIKLQSIKNNHIMKTGSSIKENKSDHKLSNTEQPDHFLLNFFKYILNDKNKTSKTPPSFSSNSPETYNKINETSINPLIFSLNLLDTLIPESPKPKITRAPPSTSVRPFTTTVKSTVEPKTNFLVELWNTIYKPSNHGYATKIE